MSNPWLGAVGLLALLASAPALASGSAPIVPATQTFASPAACRAELERLLADERGRTTNGRVQTAPGETREVQLVTDGVQASAGAVRYDSALWFHHGRRDAVANRLRLSHTYERRQRICEGAVLIITGDNGFTSQTFE
jgi:hypothetical protein